MITEEKLNEIDKSLQLYHLSCRTGSPSDKQIAEEQMLDNAPYSLRLLIEAVKDLRETPNGQYHLRLNQHNQLLINTMFSLLTPEQHEQLKSTPHRTTVPPLDDPDKLVVLSAQYWNRAAREAPDAQNAAFFQREAYNHVVNQLYALRDKYEAVDKQAKQPSPEPIGDNLFTSAEKTRFLLMHHFGLAKQEVDAVLQMPKVLEMYQAHLVENGVRRP